MNSWKLIIPGVLAGMLSSLVFTAVHHLVICDIWFSAGFMIASGAVCGGLLTWTYSLISGNLAVKSWTRFNVLYLVMFVLLGVVSILVFEPITTIPALIMANEPPTELFGESGLMTIIFVVAFTGLLSWLHAKTFMQVLSILITNILLIAVLGMNVSVLGLVAIPMNAWLLVAELFGLIISIILVYAGGVMIIKNRTLAWFRETR